MNYPIQLIFFLFITIFFNQAGFAQMATSNVETNEKQTIINNNYTSPYQLDTKREVGLLSLALGTQLAGITVINNIEPLTIAEIELLQPSQIKGFGFDRKTVRHFSAKAHHTSDFFLFGSMALPVVLMADKNIRKDFWKVSTMASEAFLLNAGLTTLVKGTVQRTRPYAYNPLVSVEEKMTKTARTSFFSGHTSAVSVLSFFSAKVYTDYHPESKWKPMIWTAAAVIPATTGYLRYRAGKHFPTDVIVGYGVGAAIGILIPHLHRSNKVRKFKVSPMAGGDVVGLSLRGVF